MPLPEPGIASEDRIEAFIARWAESGAAERANFQSFANELCDLLGVDRPEPSRADAASNRYSFEHPVTFPDGSTGRIDLYKRGAFVVEAKQGSDQRLAEQLALFGGTGAPARRGTAVRGTKNWTAAMQGARGQAERYAKALPVDHGWPPFLVTVDVGHCFELYADFSLTGKSYSQFPDAQGFRIPLDGLRDPKIRERLRLVWTEPLSLDPSRRAAEVTRLVSRRLAVIARALEAEHLPEKVAGFLMRCLFSMFAEDVGLLPPKCFTTLLQTMRGREPRQLVAALERLWADMDSGAEFSGIASDAILRFNGGLFKERTALPLEPEHLGLLIDAAQADWRDVEPAIFGTFLEQALDSRERRKLGAEFTPRRWVERLVMPAVIEPLRERWDNAKATALAYGIAGNREAAVKAVKEFHHELCHLRILDPACGTGNFLYVTMEHLKRLEGEVLDLLRNDLGEPEATLELERFTVDPHQFLGIEINPRAATIAEVVLWIGYLQWHFRTRGRVMPAQPVLKNFRNITPGDAILDYDGDAQLVRDKQGRPVTRWDGHSMKTDLLTGREVPDETRRIELYRYVNPRPAKWPDADFIIGNPPFTGGKDLRDRLGNYAEALWAAYPDMPRSADLVMYWWRRAADLVRTGKAQRFGLITTNSLPQTFNRRVVAAQLDAKPPLGLVFAIPDHPWYLGSDMAAVRIAMTVGAAGKQEGQLFRVVDPRRNAAQGGDELRSPESGLIISNLMIGIDLDTAKPLQANDGLCSPGVKLHGSGFIVTPERAKTLGLGTVPGLDAHIRPYRHGRDLTARSRGVMVIDLFGLSEREAGERFPAVYQHILQTVRAEREAKVGKSKDMQEYAKKWWLFGKPRSELRPGLEGLSRYIATAETTKHRVFQFLDASILPDNMLVNIAIDDAFILGVLSSQSHVAWALAAGGRLGVGNDPRYSKSRCFDPFPFPTTTEAQRQTIRELAEHLDAHRKQVLAAHQDLTLTGLYNVLEKLRGGEGLTTKEQDIHERGLVSVMKHLHDRIDAAVFDAYGWPRDLSDQEILGHLVALNKERRAEEAKGLVRWLRPEYQAPAAKTITVGEQGRLDITHAPSAAGTSRKTPWPKALPDRITGIRGLLAAQPKPSHLEELARRFQRAPRDDVQEVLNALVALGLARRLDDNRYAP